MIMGAESMDDSKLPSEEALELMPTSSSAILLSESQVSGNVEQRTPQDNSDTSLGEYRLYKARFAGLIAIVSASKFDILNIFEILSPS